MYMKDKNTLEGMVIPRKQGLTSKTVFWSIIGVSSSVFWILATYAWYNAGAYDTISPYDLEQLIWLSQDGTLWNIIYPVASTVEKIIFWGIIDTIDNLDTVVSKLDQESVAVTEYIESFLPGWDEISNESYAKITSLWAQAYWDWGISSANFNNNILTQLWSTLASFAITTAWVWYILKNTVKSIFIQDKADLSQRLRHKFFNMFRWKTSSRNIDIPKKGWKTFDRV